MEVKEKRIEGRRIESGRTRGIRKRGKRGLERPRDEKIPNELVQPSMSPNTMYIYRPLDLRGQVPLYFENFLLMGIKSNSKSVCLRLFVNPNLVVSSKKMYWGNEFTSPTTARGLSKRKLVSSWSQVGSSGSTVWANQGCIP
jgi:hypothetical protein